MKSWNFGLVSIFSILVSSGHSQVSWYKSFKGSIDKYAVTMHLYKTDHQYYGYYYYDSKEQPVYFLGDDTTQNGSLRLSVFLPDQDAEENFVFSISANAANGTWKNNSKTLSFSAVESTQSLNFDYVYTSGSVELRPNLAESPTATYEGTSIWPKGNSASDVFLKKIIDESFQEKNSTEDIGKILLRHKKQLFDDYLKDNKNLKKEDLENPYMFTLDEVDRLLIIYQSSKLLTLVRYSYAYTGGAHGNYGTTFIPLDIVANKKLSLDNVITAEGKKQLTKLLEKYFRKAYSVKEKDPLTEGGLFENKIEPNNNFYLTTKGIGFNYMPYEIGPYAMGEIQIFIPFAELNNYLQPYFKKLIE